MPIAEPEVVGTDVDEEDVDVELIPHRTHEEILARLASRPSVRYPKTYIDMLDREFKMAKQQIASGELIPQTVDEMAAELGIDLG